MPRKSHSESIYSVSHNQFNQLENAIIMVGVISQSLELVHDHLIQGGVHNAAYNVHVHQEQLKTVVDTAQTILRDIQRNSAPDLPIINDKPE